VRALPGLAANTVRRRRRSAVCKDFPVNGHPAAGFVDLHGKTKTIYISPNFRKSCDELSDFDA
jgi:hypothetical protein